MKKLLTPAAIALSAMLLFSGCMASLGSGNNRKATVGQELIDLQKARNAGAITESEYQAQKAKLLRK